VGEVITLKGKKKRGPIFLSGVKYIPLEEAAQRIGVEIRTMYEWNSSGRFRGIKINYAGHSYYEEKGIEPFKMTLVKKA
jgi:hypothetical protein